MDEALLRKMIEQMAMERMAENGGQPLIGKVMVVEEFGNGKLGCVVRPRPFDLAKYCKDTGITISDHDSLRKLRYHIDDAALTDLPCLVVFTKPVPGGGAEFEASVQILRAGKAK